MLPRGFFRANSSYCPKCGQDTVVAYSTTGTPIPMITQDGMTTEKIMQRINKATIGDMVCGNCGEHFLCDFSLGFPRAISKSGLKETFFDNYLSKNR